jgi:hypothetical protein
MIYKRLGFGLGLFSIALGTLELLAPRRIARALDAEGSEGLVRAFGAREVVAGVGLLANPAHSTLVWNRVAGDGMDLAALGAAVRNAPRNAAVWSALAFVAGATALDIFTARGLDRTTGKALPAEEPQSTKRATSIEPDLVSHAQAPAVAAP